MTKEEQEEMYADMQTLEKEQLEKVKDFEDAMDYLDSLGVPHAETLTARIIMLAGERK